MAKDAAIEKKSVKSNYSNPVKNVQVDKILVENFVSLQKVMTNLAVKFDDLSTQISKLLELFEISAKTLAEKDYVKKEDNKKVIERLDSLLEHNKVIAKGISLLHEKGMPEEQEVVIMPQKTSPQPIRPAPGQLTKEKMPLRPGIPRVPPQRIQEKYINPSPEFPKRRYVEE